MTHDSKFRLRIASPCKAPWDSMDGDARVRFCGECEQSVYNLSAMTETEARRLLEQREGRVCVRFYRRGDGTVLTSDCAVGQKRSFLRAGGRAVAAMAAVAAGLSTLSGCADDYAYDDGYDDGEPRPTRGPLMGSPLPDGDWGEGAEGLEGRGHAEEIMGEAVLPPEDFVMGKIAPSAETE